jgi:hypothetical protein
VSILAAGWVIVAAYLGSDVVGCGRWTAAFMEPEIQFPRCCVRCLRSFGVIDVNLGWIIACYHFYLLGGEWLSF